MADKSATDRSRGGRRRRVGPEPGCRQRARWTLSSAISRRTSGRYQGSIPGWIAVERTHRAARPVVTPRPARRSRSQPARASRSTAGSKLKAAAK